MQTAVMSSTWLYVVHRSREDVNSYNNPCILCNQVVNTFPQWGHFPKKFSIALSGETNDRIKKTWGGFENGSDLLYHHAKYGGDCGSCMDHLTP